MEKIPYIFISGNGNRKHSVYLLGPNWTQNLEDFGDVICHTIYKTTHKTLENLKNNFEWVNTE